MKRWGVLVSLVSLVALMGFLSGCNGESSGVTQSASIADLQAVSKGEGASLDSQGGKPGGPPPQEAFDVCIGKSEGDAAALTTPDGETVSGTCQRVEDELVLVPEGGQHGPGSDREPPQEAFEACEGKGDGDTAELTDPNGETVTGTCRTIEDQLILVPENGRPNGPPPKNE